MKFLLPLVALLALCSPPPKTYTKPEIGMSYITDFVNLCGLSFDDYHSLTTEKGETKTYLYNATDLKGIERRNGCAGTFTFVNDKLVSIEH